MAGLFGLFYCTTALGGSVIEASQEQYEGQESYKKAILMNSPTYMVGENLYFTKTKELCHICINRKTGAKQIRAGKKYGKGIILYDYGEEYEKQKKEINKVNSLNQLNKAKLNQWKYYEDSDGRRAINNSNRFIVFSNEKSNCYYFQYLTQYNGKWYRDETQPVYKISREEWIERGCDTTHYYETLQNILKKEKQEEIKRQTLELKEYQLQKKDNEKYEQNKKEILIYSFLSIIGICLLISL